MIVLHLDDIATLNYIKKELGDIGIVRKNNKYYNAEYVIWNFNDIYKYIVPLFNKYQLLTNKKHDFLLFAKAVQLKYNVNVKRNKGIKISESEYEEFLSIKSNMFHKDKLLDSNNTNIIISPYWLLGFVEGEGTFGYKYTVPYFQIAQNARNENIMNKIDLYLSQLVKNNSSDLKYFNMTKVVNKKTNVLSYTIQDVEILHKYIVPFFSSLKFKSRKELDYKMWVLAMNIRMKGYHLTKEGKTVLLKIAKGTNKYRYSNCKNNNIELPSVEEIRNLFSKPTPFSDDTKLTYKDQISNYALKHNRWRGYSVFVYEEGKEIDQSPFSSYKFATKMLGLNSNIISRYVDTGKLYKNKYLFSSEKLDK